VPAFQQGFLPDSISTDLHTGSMNAGMKSMSNVMSIVLSLGSPLDKVIAMSTWNPAKEIKRPDLGSLDVGADADVAVLRVEKGQFGFIDSAGAANSGTQRIVNELTVRKGVSFTISMAGRARTGRPSAATGKSGKSKSAFPPEKVVRLKFCGNVLPTIGFSQQQEICLRAVIVIAFVVPSRLIRVVFRTRAEIIAENLFLRQQLPSTKKGKCSGAGQHRLPSSR
jgi:hypothetical protein